jgi:hypothetical protein
MISNLGGDVPEDKRMKPVLIHVDPDDWAEFQKLCGNYRVSKRIRKLVRQELILAKAVATK